MVSQRRLLSVLTLLIVISFFVVACERPLGGTDEATTNESDPVDDPDVGGGVDTSGDTTTDSGTTDGATTDGGTTEGETTGDTAVDSGDAAGDTAGETATDAGAGDTATDTGGETAADTGGEGETQDDSAEAGGGVGDTTTDTGGETAAGDTTTDSAASETTTTTAVPASHTVAAGENLYRIGLKYGISWVAIANANNLANPNVLTVGQVLTLPGGNTPTPTPTPSPQTETTYVVQAGDNLYRIGLRFGISWVQIAEANGLVNPNMITVGSELKIPVNTPGPAPAFSHVVKPGETLFLISLQYGVAWPAIAEANNLTSPYVIYVGQMLQIPGS